MEILLTIYNEKILGDKVKRFYTENYRQFKKKYPNRPYTKKQLTTNIINALSIKGCTITEEHIHGSIIKQWMENGWKEFKRSHWFYAIKITLKNQLLYFAMLIRATRCRVSIAKLDL